MTSRRAAADALLVLAASLDFGWGVYAALIGSGMSTAAGIMTGWELTKDLAEPEARHRGGTTPPGFQSANVDSMVSQRAAWADRLGDAVGDLVKPPVECRSPGAHQTVAAASLIPSLRLRPARRRSPPHRVPRPGPSGPVGRPDAVRL